MPAHHVDMLQNKTNNPTTKALEREVTRLLQERLSDPKTATDNYTAATLAHIGFAGNYTAQENVMDLHYEFLRRIIVARGGFDAFDRSIAKTMVM